MTGIILYPETTILEDKCPCCEKQLEITVKQTPSGMGFKVSIENIEEPRKCTYREDWKGDGCYYCAHDIRHPTDWKWWK